MTSLTVDQVLAHDIRDRFGQPPTDPIARGQWVDTVEAFLDANPLPAPVAGQSYQIRNRGRAVAIAPDPDAALERWLFRWPGVIVTGTRRTQVVDSVHLVNVVDLDPDAFDRGRGRVVAPPA